MSDNGKSSAMRKQDLRIKELEQKLIETAQELGCMIDMANARLELGISISDTDDPDYFDSQTVHEAMMLAKAI